MNKCPEFHFYSTTKLKCSILLISIGATIIHRKDQLQSRKSYRLKNYDYSQPGYYFVTICTYQKRKIFGIKYGDDIKLNSIGKIIHQEWLNIHNRFKFICLDQFIVMPDHFHAIIQIKENHGKTISNIVGAFKSISSNQIRKHIQINDRSIIYNPLWQSRFHDHIIKSERELNIVRRYIRNNPKNLKY